MLSVCAYWCVWLKLCLFYICIYMFYCIYYTFSQTHSLTSLVTNMLFMISEGVEIQKSSSFPWNVILTYLRGFSWLSKKKNSLDIIRGIHKWLCGIMRKWIIWFHYICSWEQHYTMKLCSQVWYIYITLVVK